MRQPDIVAAKLLRILQDLQAVFCRKGLPVSIGFFMDTDSLQEGALPVEKNVRPFGLDLAKTHAVRNGIAAAFYRELYIIELRILRAPQFRLCLKDSLATAVPDHDLAAYSKFRYFKNCRIIHLRIDFDSGTDQPEVRIRNQTHAEILYAHSGNIDQLDITVNSAIVEPVGIVHRDILRRTGRIHRDNDPVIIALMQQIRDIHIERR